VRAGEAPEGGALLRMELPGWPEPDESSEQD